MHIKKYKHPETYKEQLLKLITENYSETKNFTLFFEEYKKALLFCTDNPNIEYTAFALHEGEDVLAHTALVQDKRRPGDEAFFGFMEFPEELETFKKVWHEIIKEAQRRNIKKLLGPVNGSIWHQYRCIKHSDNEPFFKQELPTKLYYYEFLKKENPKKEMEYYSAYRKKYEGITSLIGKDFQEISKKGFSIQAVDAIPQQALGVIAQLSRTIFGKSWGYTELTLQEFLQLYSKEVVNAHLSKLYLLYSGNDIVGFCSTVMEDTKTLICKTICILPEFQGLGLGNALAYRVHKDAKENGIKKVIYALIREGNNVKNFPKDEAVIFRKYAAFEFDI